MGMISKIEDEKGTREMKKYLMMVALMPLMVVYGERLDGWQYYVKDGVAILGNQTYDEGKTTYDNVQAYSAQTEGILTIPSVLNGYQVVRIGRGAFTSCDKISQITIPSGVTEIGASAFYGCSSLTSVAVPMGVTEIGGSTFRFCTKLTSVTMPPGVTSIGDCAFYGCAGLTSVAIPFGVTSIKDLVFFGCTGLTSVTMSPRVTSIGDSAFCECTGLTSVAIPFGVTNFTDTVFSGCTGVTSVTVPGDVPLSTLFPDSYKTITRVTIADGATRICSEAFKNCENLETVTIPNSVTKIGHEAFKGCDSLMNITIPESVTAIGYDALDCAAYWTSHYKRELNGGSGSTPSTGGGVTGGGSTGYALSTSSVGDSTITSMTVTGDTAIGSFLLADGKVFDMAIRLVNAANAPVRLSLPSGYTYEKIGVADPLTFPANSTNMVTITRTADKVFLVSRQELRPVQ